MTHTYTINFNYDSYPTDFMVPYAVKYGQIPPVLQIDIIRPDGRDFRIYSSALPPSLILTAAQNEFSARVFSTDSLIIENLRLDKSLFKYNQDESLSSDNAIFSNRSRKGFKGKISSEGNILSLW